MRKQHSTRWSLWLTAGMTILVMPMLLGCPFSSSKNPVNEECPPNCPPELDRSTPAKLLTDFFKNAYDNRDSIAYNQMLHEEFKFTFLEEDTKGLPVGPDFSWGRTDDLRSTGAMFRAETVTDITLNLFISSNENYLGGDCEGCRELETTVTLRVSTVVDDNPDDPNLTYAVDSPQIFVCRPDEREEFPGQWVIWRQLDVPRDAKRADSPKPVL